MSITCRSRSPDSGERGFTLVELLVVIIIIAILSAVAIPAFLNQRRRAADQAARSDLHQLAKFQETYLLDADTYGTITGMRAADQNVKVTRSVTVTVVRFDSSRSFCLSAKHVASVKTWYYDSLAGGLLPEDSPWCVLATAGTPGDTVTG